MRVPTVAEEAARDLVRAREDARADAGSASAVEAAVALWAGLRGCRLDPSARPLAGQHRRELDQPWLRVAFDEAHGAVLAVQARRDRLDAAIGELAATPAWAPLVGRLGLSPSEQSSGGWRSQGSITKTGNSHARRLLVEAAWHHRKPYRPSRDLQARHAGQPAAVRERADRGNHRLHQRWCRLDARAKRSTISVVAVARELAGWCWSLAVLEA